MKEHGKLGYQPEGNTLTKQPTLTARADISLAAVNNGWKRIAASPARTGGPEIRFAAYEKNIRNQVGRDVINLYIHFEKDGSISRAVINYKFDSIYLTRETRRKRYILMTWLTAEHGRWGHRPRGGGH